MKRVKADRKSPNMSRVAKKRNLRQSIDLKQEITKTMMLIKIIEEAVKLTKNLLLNQKPKIMKMKIVIVRIETKDTHLNEITAMKVV